MVASVKIDLSGAEVLARPTVLRSVSHPYPDGLPELGTVRCYTLVEVFAEKIRAMGERGRPRDLYDIVNLFRRDDLHGERRLIVSVLREKCPSKGVEVPTLATIERAETRAELAAEWENMLGHQLPATPPFNAFWSELADLLAWLEGTRIPVPLGSISIPHAQPVDASWSPPGMVTTWGTRSSLESIRFAAANRLCVELGYQGTRRFIEPYSLRRSQAGNTLLYAVRADSREPRAYRVDHIECVRVTDRMFTPVYRVELDTAGPVSAPSVATKPRRATRSTRSTVSGMVYIIECPYCHKQFRRKTDNTLLRPHKTPDGSRCYGRGRGILINTQY